MYISESQQEDEGEVDSEDDQGLDDYEEIEVQEAREKGHPVACKKFVLHQNCK